MPLFSYKAIKADGSDRAGTHSAERVQDVERWLAEQGMHPIEITIADQAANPTQQKIATFWQGLRGISIDDRILICRQLSTMLGAGVPILKALRILVEQTTSPIVVPMLTDVANRIEDGASLSDSLAVYPRFTSQLFYNIVRVGEETGTLDQSFIYLAELFENEKEVVERIKVATRYPKIVIVTLLAAVFFLMSYVVPKFMALFTSAKVDLPLPTRILVVMSRATTEYFWLLAIVVALIVFGYRFAMRDEGVQMARDRLWLRMPIFGDLFLKIFMSRFCRVFSALLRSGVDIIRTLELSATSMDNLVLFSMVDKVTVDVRDGMELHLAMERHKFFPAMVIQMVAIGEQAGQVDEMMSKVAEYYEKETSYIIKNLSTLIEPILLVCMGIMVGFLALAIYMPMWDMMKVMQG